MVSLILISSPFNFSLIPLYFLHLLSQVNFTHGCNGHLQVVVPWTAGTLLRSKTSRNKKTDKIVEFENGRKHRKYGLNTRDKSHHDKYDIPFHHKSKYQIFKPPSVNPAPSQPPSQPRPAVPWPRPRPRRGH